MLLLTTHSYVKKSWLHDYVTMGASRSEIHDFGGQSGLCLRHTTSALQQFCGIMEYIGNSKVNSATNNLVYCGVARTPKMVCKHEVQR